MAMPNLRFKADDGSAFPDWQPLQLSSICSYEKQRAEDGNFIETANMLENFGGVKLEPNKTKRGVVYHPHDVLLSNIRPYLKKAWLSDRQGVCSSDVLVLRPQNVIPYFLFTLIASDKFIKYVMSSVKGSKMPRGDKDAIMKWHILLPSTMEQSKISTILLAVDDVINKQKAEIEVWELRKKGVAQRLFSQEVRFKADDGSFFPDWKDTTLGALGSFYGGLTNKTKEDFVDGNCPFITYKNVYLNTFAKPNQAEMVSIKPKEKQNKVKQFDLLFTLSSETFEEVGLTSVYLYDDEPYLNSFCKGFRFNKLENICPEFMGYLLRSSKVRRNIIPMGQGISRINISTKQLSKLKLQLPSLPEQQKIVDCLDAIDEVIAKAKAELELWRELKRGLLQQLFV